MIRNTIKENRVRLNLTQKQLADSIQVDDHTTMTISLIESGRVLPTKPYLEALCSVFEVEPDELYNTDDLDLLGEAATSKANNANNAIMEPASDREHSGLVEFRTWMKPHEKKNIEAATAYLGYRSMAEWFREAYRNLYQRMLRTQNTHRVENRKE